MDTWNLAYLPSWLT